jgi:serine/threonine protein kinase
VVPAGQAATRPRKRIGRYAVTGRIGRGGMGMVYRGYDQALEREVAVKTLTVEGTLDIESRKRFEIEAKAAARLQHPNILTVFELGEERGVPFIVMELLPGMDLEALLRSGEELLLEEKLDVVVQVCRGLAFAHEHGIVHRDIKPSNVRLLDDGSVKIMDFGIAKLQGTGITQSGVMVGTVHYMSPEQIRGQTLDGRSDVFSLGVILYELLAGRRPFSGQGATEVLYKIVHEAPAPLSEARAVPMRLQAVVDKALCKDRDGRHASATQLAEELSAVLAELSREATVQVALADVEVLNASRRLLKEGRPDESLRRLKELSERLPRSLEARRALRAAGRELQRRQQAPDALEDDFPELEATFQSPPTQVAPRTESHPPPPTRVSPPTLLAPAPAPSRTRPGGHLLLAGSGLALVLAVGAGLVLLRGAPRGDGGREPSRGVTLPPAGREAVSVRPAPASRTITVDSDPPGATVVLDGGPLEGVTPLSLELDPGAPHRLAVSMEGYRTRELRLEAGAVESELRLALEPVGPPGFVTITSSFPIDVSWQGRMLARGRPSPRVPLPAGRHSLTVAASAYFLKASVPVDVRGGAETQVAAPGLGKLSIRANPDNCQVLIDGVFVDYPPILDKAIAAGTHAVAFKWPDGTRTEQAAQVSPGRVAYVMGRRD